MVVDTSALMAVLLNEPQAPECRSALRRDPEPVFSAVTLGEALIVAGRRGKGAEIARLLAALQPRTALVDEAGARAAAAAYARYGKGVHPARLNLVDCFGYALAQELGAPLLYVGDDFARTDVRSALPAPDTPELP